MKDVTFWMQPHFTISILFNKKKNKKKSILLVRNITNNFKRKLENSSSKKVKRWGQNTEQKNKNHFLLVTFQRKLNGKENVWKDERYKEYHFINRINGMDGMVLYLNWIWFYIFIDNIIYEKKKRAYHFSIHSILFNLFVHTPYTPVRIYNIQHLIFNIKCN